MNAPLTVWAVEQHEPYVGTFVCSLWISEELARAELARLERVMKENHFSQEHSVEEWTVGELPSE